MYNNLEAEMARNKVTRKDLMILLDVRYATIIDKLKGRYSFTLDEALKIKNELFPDIDFEYLFDTEDQTA